MHAQKEFSFAAVLAGVQGQAAPKSAPPNKASQVKPVSKPAATKSADSKPATTMSTNGKPAGTKAADGKPAAAKPTSIKPAAGKASVADSTKTTPSMTKTNMTSEASKAKASNSTDDRAAHSAGPPSKKRKAEDQPSKPAPKAVKVMPGTDTRSHLQKIQDKYQKASEAAAAKAEAKKPKVPMVAEMTDQARLQVTRDAKRNVKKGNIPFVPQAKPAKARPSSVWHGTAKKEKTSNAQSNTSTSRQSAYNYRLQQSHHSGRVVPAGQLEPGQEDSDVDSIPSGSDGDQGYGALEAEEEASLRAARKEDQRALREEAAHRREKMAKKRAFEKQRK